MLGCTSDYLSVNLLQAGVEDRREADGLAEEHHLKPANCKFLSLGHEDCYEEPWNMDANEADGPAEDHHLKPTPHVLPWVIRTGTKSPARRMPTKLLALLRTII